MTESRPYAARGRGTAEKQNQAAESMKGATGFARASRDTVLVLPPMGFG